MSLLAGRVFSVTFAHGSNERSTDLDVLSLLHAHTDLWPLLLALHAPRRAAATGA
jgi:hypothetical protein